VEVWPDNLLPVSVFISMGTQWRVATGGVIGLDYTALPVVMRLVGVPPAERAEVFEAVRTMEDAALTKMHADS
jgi:hypothetical protein